MSRFNPQFIAPSISVEIKKGNSVKFDVILSASSNINPVVIDNSAKTITVYNSPVTDLRGALVFGEIRELNPGYKAVAGVTGTTTNTSGVISLSFNGSQGYSDNSAFDLGDSVSIEGSGIIGAKITEIAANSITVNQNATANRSGAVLRRSRSLTSFTTLPTASSSGKAVLVSATANASATSISVDALPVAINNGTTLYFGVRETSGWRYVGAATLTSQGNQNATSLSVSSLTQEVPIGAIAFTGSSSFATFTAALDPADTQYLIAGQYGFDFLVRESNGNAIAILEATITLKENYSDLG
jgi:hypothetical protein